jgi:hypothetical protein
VARFTFDKGTHVYRHGRRVLPGITSVIRWAGHSDDEWCTRDALARGSAVHAATLALDLGDEPVLPAAWAGYLDAYRAFRQALRCEWRELEHPRYSLPLGFAGTPDRAGSVSRREAVVELKTAQSGARVAWHGYQLAAQDLLLGGVRGMRQRLAVYLLPDGRFKVLEYDGPADYLHFLEALSDYNRAA